MSSKVPYEAVKSLIGSVAGVPVTEWDSLVDNINQRTDPFISIEDGEGTEAVRSIGVPTKNWMEEEGLVTVHIFVPARLTLTAARDIAESLQTKLRMQQVTPAVRIFTVDPPAPGIIADGLWTSMLMGITYRYMFTAPTFAP
jgi:hypothetical protein